MNGMGIGAIGGAAAGGLIGLAALGPPGAIAGAGAGITLGRQIGLNNQLGTLLNTLNEIAGPFFKRVLGNFSDAQKELLLVGKKFASDYAEFQIYGLAMYIAIDKFYTSSQKYRESCNSILEDSHCIMSGVLSLSIATAGVICSAAMAQAIWQRIQKIEAEDAPPLPPPVVEAPAPVVEVPAPTPAPVRVRRVRRAPAPAAIPPAPEEKKESTFDRVMRAIREFIQG